MAKKKPNVVGLAKGKKTTAKKAASKKESPANVKAKAVVKELIQDVTLPTEEKDTFELIEDKNVQWFEDELAKLENENQELRNKLANVPTDTGGGKTQEGVILLFHEFQGEYLKQPANIRNQAIIYLPALLKKMDEKFPFLKEHRRV